MPRLTTEQLRAVNHEQGNILVSASAGSGKTHTMIERIKRVILQKNVSVNEILCVTFTEKAAFEMKEKLKKALKENFSQGQRKRLMREVVELATADISTLHSFCGKLIRNYFFTVGLSPDFEILDETKAQVMRSESLDKTMREFYDGGEEWFYNLIDRHESARSDARLRQLVLGVHAFYNSEANPQEQMQKHLTFCSEEGVKKLINDYKADLDASLLKIKEQAFSCLQVFNHYQLQKACAFTKTFIADVNAILNSDSVYCVKNYENYALKLDFERKLEPVCVERKDLMKSLRDRFKKLVQKFSKHLVDEKADLRKMRKASEHADGLIRITKRFEEVYAQEKRQENALDFNDLEHFALKILSDERTADAIKKKYKYVFVDEYQDINGVQERIINMVSADNLFMVGDVKQSIYGFRGCRPEFFSEKFNFMQKEGQTVVTLNHNFRSASKVIDLVNAIFDFCMTKEFFSYDYSQTSRLLAGADWANEHKGRTQVHFYPSASKKRKEKEEPELYDILKRLEPKEEQASNASKLVTKIIDEERGKTYYDFKRGKNKPVQLKDIVILTRGKNTSFVSSLVKGLNRHGISVNSEVKENACDFPEIGMMINALKAVDCFEQDIPLASVMKSPIGNFTNEEFIDIVRFYEDSENTPKDWSFKDAYKYYLQNATGELKDRLIRFNDYFSRVRFLSDFIGAKGVLEKLIKENGIEAYLLAQSMGTAKLNRLNKFVRSAVSGDKKLTVKEFLYKIENSPASFEFTGGLDDDDCVRVMTIHASKGLEFPVVIVCGLEIPFNSEDESGDVLFSRNYGLCSCFYQDEQRIKDETLIRGVVKEDMQGERVREEMRLFYVATTRAMCSLHLTFEAKQDSRKDKFYGADRFTDYLPLSLPVKEYSEQDFEFQSRREQTRKVLIGSADRKIFEQIKNNLNFEYANVADTVLPLKSNVTASLKIEKDDQPLTYVLFEEPSPDVEKGNIAHKILEYFNFNGNSLIEQVKELVRQGIISEEQAKKVNLDRIENALKNQVFQLIKKAKLYREKSFIAGVEADKVVQTTSNEPIVLQGIIDLLAVDENKAYVIDYKYSSLDKESLKIKYQKQLELYSYAVENVLKKPVEKKVIVNLFTGDVVVID